MKLLPLRVAVLIVGWKSSERKRRGDEQQEPGTVLVRDYHGQRHTVTVAPDGFNWQGTTYPSLSAIARAITGTAWSGAAGCGGSTADPSRRRKCSEQLFDNRITPFRCRFLARAYRGPILSISRGDTMSPNGSFATAPRCPAVLSGIHMLAGGDWTAWLGWSDSNSETSAQTIPLEGRTDSQDPAGFWPQRLLAFELRH